MNLGLFRNLCGSSPPAWLEALSAPVMALPIPYAWQHVRSAQAGFLCYVQVPTQARLPHISSFCFCCLLFTATREGWSNVSSVDGEMRQSQMTGTFHRLWSSRIRSVSLIVLIFLDLVRPFNHQNILGREKAMLSGETGHIRGIEWTGEAGDGHQVRGRPGCAWGSGAGAFRGLSSIGLMSSPFSGSQGISCEVMGLGCQ